MCTRTLISVEAQNPLSTVRNLLGAIWNHASLDGLFIAHWQDGKPPQSVLLSSLDQLDRADPFAPVMHRNSACQAAQILQDHPNQRLGFVFRPCELRCFNVLNNKLKLDLNDGLLISSDCLATFPSEDFEWRLNASEHQEQMTQSILHFAAQGGLNISRYRNSCQFCVKPYPENADLSIELFGIKTSEYLVVKSGSLELVDSLGLDEFNGQAISEDIASSRQRILLRLTEWRQQAFAYATSHLEERHKSIEGLIEHLAACITCRQAIRDCCPLVDSSWKTFGSRRDFEGVASWLQTCSGCGMCESDCPVGFPLFSAILFLTRSLQKK